MVRCPSIFCEQEIILKKWEAHLNLDHSKYLNVDDEWKFDGTKEELIENICCINAYDKKFFPQFFINGNFLYFRYVLGMGRANFF